MSAADKAYAAAVDEIARVREAGGTRLDLSGAKFRALDRLPDEIAGWDGLQWLGLSQTKISDAGLAHLAGLAGLRTLGLNQTQISDAGLAHLAGLAGLQLLGLENTKITHLDALSRMKTLKDLDVGGTGVRDLRPICDLPLKSAEYEWGLQFAGTPAAALDPKLLELAGVKDNGARTKQTLAYLRGLPKYPAKLAWLEADNSKPQEKPSPAPQMREEPPLTRGQVKTSAAQIKILLAQPRLTQNTAKEVAINIRAAIEDVQRENNSLPEPFQTIVALADALDNIGNIRITPKQKDMVDDLKLRIAQLEATVEKLTAQLADAGKARAAAEAVARAYSPTDKFKTKVAEGGGDFVWWAAKFGLVVGAAYFLGPSNAVVGGLFAQIAKIKP